jgi:hypothetical protein
MSAGKCASGVAVALYRVACVLGYGARMTSHRDIEERVIYQQRYQGAHLDFRSRPIFARYDACQFVNCTILIDEATADLAFTDCEFQDCNIAALEPDASRNIAVDNNVFRRPIAERRADFNSRLAAALAARAATKAT